MKRFVLLAMIVGCATTDTDPPPTDDTVDPLPDEDDPADPTPPPPIDPLSALMNWQACMQRADYDAAGMAAAWSGHSTTVNHTCQGCHATGGGGFVASADPAFGFETIKTELHLFRTYFTVDASGRVVQNLPLLTDVGTGQNTPEHPLFDTAAGNLAFSALRDFYDRTEARRLAGECSPTTLR